MKDVLNKFNACIKKDCILVPAVDESGRIRIDDLEMRPDVQKSS
jgi:trans-2-enoyl-CoA reductase